MKKSILMIILLSATFFVMGAFLGDQISTSAEETCDIQSNAEAASSDCKTLKYMGGKWYKGTPNYKSFADIASVKTAATNARSHYEGLPGITIKNWSGTGTNNIGVFDEAHSYDSWTGLAEGSYIDGKFPDTYYQQVDIIVNTKNSNGTNASKYSASKLRGLMNHEFGHAFGLGHSTSSSRLMYCYDSRTSTYLTSTEKGYLNDIY